MEHAAATASATIPSSSSPISTEPSPKSHATKNGKSATEATPSATSSNNSTPDRSQLEARSLAAEEHHTAASLSLASEIRNLTSVSPTRSTQCPIILNSSSPALLCFASATSATSAVSFAVVFRSLAQSARLPTPAPNQPLTAPFSGRNNRLCLSQHVRSHKRWPQQHRQHP